MQPYRCLHANSVKEDLLVPPTGCLLRRILSTEQCSRAERWEQTASLDCSNRTMVLSSALKTLDWCDLAAFHGVEFICCPFRGNRSISVSI